MQARTPHLCISSRNQTWGITGPGWGGGVMQLCLGLAVPSEPQSPPGLREGHRGSLGGECVDPGHAEKPPLSLTALPGPSAHPRTWQLRGPRWAASSPDLPCSSCATCRRSSATSCTSARSSPWLRACSRYSPAPSGPGPDPTPPPSDPGVQRPSPSSLRPGVQAAAPLWAQTCAPVPPHQVARLLNVPTVLTEQYPQGLGPTVPELGAQGLQPHSKTCFSMVPVVQQELDARPQLRSVLLCGLETQACILVRPPLTLGTSSPPETSPT